MKYTVHYAKKGNRNIHKTYVIEAYNHQDALRKFLTKHKGQQLRVEKVVAKAEEKLL